MNHCQYLVNMLIVEPVAISNMILQLLPRFLYESIWTCHITLLIRYLWLFTSIQIKHIITFKFRGLRSIWVNLLLIIWIFRCFCKCWSNSFVLCIVRIITLTLKCKSKLVFTRLVLFNKSFISFLLRYSAMIHGRPVLHLLLHLLVQEISFEHRPSNLKGIITKNLTSSLLFQALNEWMRNHILIQHSWPSFRV